MSRWHSNETQIRWVCRMLLQGKEISHACEIAAVKGWRLAAIIWQLIHRYKWPIAKRKGESRIVYYRLGKDADKATLETPRSFLKKKGDAPTSPKNRNK